MTDLDRTQFIGGSDAPSVIDVSPWRSRVELWLEKTGQASAPVDDPERDRRLARGKRFEPVIRSMVIEELRARGHNVRVHRKNARYIDRNFPYIASEIDCELQVDGEILNCEIKSTNQFAAKWWGEPGTDEVPIYYAAQVMHGLMVRPRRAAILAALIGTDDLRIHWVPRDEEIIRAIRQREIEFWSMVQARTPPPVSTGADALLLWPADSGAAVEASGEALAAFNRLRELRAQIKVLETEESSCADTLEAAIGKGSTLTLDGRPLATWKAQSANRFDLAAFTEAHPDLAAKFRTTTTSRVLRLK